MPKNSLFSLTLIALLIFTCCSCAKKTAVQKEVEVVASDAERILFIDLVVKKSERNMYKINVVNQIITPGSFKQDAESNQPYVPGDLRLSFADQEVRTLKSHRVAQPLKQRMEFIGPDGNLMWAEVDAEETTVSKRLQIPAEARKLKLEVLLEDFTYYTLNTIVL